MEKGYSTDIDKLKSQRVDKKLHNLLDFTDHHDFSKKPKKTKRTEVAKDVLLEKSELHNLLSFKDFEQSVTNKKPAATKRTDVAKDVLN